MRKPYLPAAFIHVRRHAFRYALGHATNDGRAEAAAMATDFEDALRRAGHPLARSADA